MKILFKNITALNKDEYLELIKFHGKKNNLKYYSYTAVMGLILIIGMSYQIILKNYVSLILLALIFIGFLLNLTLPIFSISFISKGDDIH